MADLGVPGSGITVDDDTFERDLKEMLKDGPNLNDTSSVMSGGHKQEANVGKPQAMVRPDSVSKPGLTRSHTVPPATSNIPLSSPERNGSNGQQPFKPLELSAAPGGSSSKIDTIKSWSINTYKCTRQMLSERFGKASRTVDVELETKIETLRDAQSKYSNILRLSRALSSHFFHVIQTQRAMGDAFSELSQKSPELQEEFSYNSETQKVLFKNGETLLAALNFFTNSINTLCNKTMEDTLQTIKQYEAARLEFDAYRADFEALQAAPHDAMKMDAARKNFNATKEKYDKLKGDVAIKLQFLDENRVKVTQRQFYLLHRGFQAYVSGCNADLETVITQYKIQPVPPTDNTGVSSPASSP